ncbi:MAG TPA: EAL domain-containing protein [Thermoanaerobaculia bacterium]|nr:EAL domain-containing protein [Thermoanaerobaculia bacterium]
MSDAGLTLYVAHLARAACAVILAILLFNFHRRYRKSYLRHWSWSWLALAVHYLFLIIGVALGPAFEPSHPLRLTASALAGAAGYLQVGWLLFGSWELWTRRHVRLRVVRWTLPLLALIGIVTGVLFADAEGSAAMRLLMRIGIYGLLTGAAFLFASWLTWTHRDRVPGFGFKLIAAGFLLYSFQQFQYFAVALSAFGDGQLLRYGLYLGFGDFVFLMLTGVGMVTVFLEDERAAADLALYEIEHLAYHDPLTGLPNRELLMDRLLVALAHAERDGRKLALFFIDIDRFKEINDSLGHAAGNSVLRILAERIGRFVRGQDTLARFGADEFGFLVHSIEKEEYAAKLAQRILDLVRRPLEVKQQELFLTASIGISFYPSDGIHSETLVRNADTAATRAKDAGGDTWRLYSADMNARAFERLALENLLHKALSNHELVLHYQPLIDLDTERVFGAEALIRWEHPQNGLLLPAEFLPVAEASGLIVPIGQWVLEQACRDGRRLQQSVGDDFIVSVNLSARQFEQPDLPAKVRRAIEQSGLAPGTLDLEITETNAMRNAEETIETLRELKKVGVQISVDDFGTGYSSLDYLRKFPIDTLKLDKTFVRDLVTEPGDAAIASAVIAMAHSLGLKVVAEGVETREQLEFLRSRRCDRIQGHLFSAALGADQLLEFLAANQRVASA